MKDTDRAYAIRCPACGYPTLALHVIGQRRLFRCDDCQREFAELQPNCVSPDEPVADSRKPATQVIATLWDPSPSRDRRGENRATIGPPVDDSVIMKRPNPGETQRLDVHADPTASTRTSILSILKHRYGPEIDDPVDDQTPFPELHGPVQSKYRLKDEIAVGGVGRVSLAVDRDLNRRVAMKTLLPEHSRSAEAISRFMEEAQTIGQLEHPNIVPIYDVGMNEAGHVFFTMKYVQGETLESIIERLQAGDPRAHATYTWSRRVQIISQICDALAFAHGRGIMHRDLKPANIMVGPYGEVQVMDWGAAKLIDSPPSNPPAGAASWDEAAAGLHLTAITPHQTAPGNVVGTAFYMSPEQAEALPQLTHATDIYALGAIMYEFFGLYRAHSGDTVFEVLQDVIHRPPPPLAHRRHPSQAIVPIELRYIIGDAMHKDPACRYASVADLQADLQRYLSGTFPVRCRATAIKRGLHLLSSLLDDHSQCVLLGISAALAATAGALIALALA